jgi:AraC-like DNA-binding protein
MNAVQEKMSVESINRALCEQVLRHAPRQGANATPIAGLQLYRFDRSNEPLYALYEPSVCLIVQGSKRVMIGDQVLHYGPMRHLVVSQDLPMSGQVLSASREAPYLCIALAVQPRMIADLMLELGRPREPAGAGDAAGLYTEDSSPNLLESTMRLLRLLDTPKDVPALAPLMQREIAYRLLSSPNGWRLARTATPDSPDQRVSRAIAWLRERYREPLRVADLARVVHMSESLLHKHFKAVTALTPIQYQKQLRLQEARRLLLVEAADAAAAAHRVGYESPSQFSREYARQFGAPPMRDRQRLLAGEQPASAAIIQTGPARMQ